MKILVVHLSDIHLTETDNRIMARIKDIKGAINGSSAEVGFNLNACFVVVSGDLVFSGKAKEFKIALDFLTNLREEIQKINNSMKIEEKSLGSGLQYCNSRKCRAGL